jgi:hypothetical protein
VNKKKVDPTKKHHHPSYHPMCIVDNLAILSCDRYNSTQDKWFIDHEKDASAYNVSNGALSDKEK